ncbi:MAG: hypothetical protein FWE82_05210, partial [Defluviitaleaceae bacterium]|nr:hypothetical protein [Defluviitaleaceae bacterium]
MDKKINDCLQKKVSHFYLDGFYSSKLGDIAARGEDSVYMGLREAYGRKNFYEHTPVFISRGHIIAGELNKSAGTEIAFISTNNGSIHDIRKNFVEQLLEDENESPETKRFVKKAAECIASYGIWVDRHESASEEERLVEASGAAGAQGYNGHLAMDFGYFLSRGIDGIAEDINNCAKKINRPEFFEALGVTAAGIGSYIKRHGEYAAACIGEDGYDCAQMSALSEACLNIAAKPASNFYEAVQYQWFLMTLADYDSYGRYDQYMFPYYERDIKNNVITRGQAKEYVKDMLRRADECGGILNMTIGGKTPDGFSAVNDLTFLIMEATRELGFKAPNLCLRISADSGEKLWNEAIDGLSRGQSIPALYNDETFIPMMRRAGFNENDANNYTLAGCSQAVVPYISNLNCDVGLYNPAKMLDLALHDGFDTKLGKQVGPHTGNAKTFSSFAQIYDAYCGQMKYCVAKGAALNNHDIAARKKILSSVRTLLMPECIEKGLGVLEGGCTYYGIQGEVIGLTNASDSLAAINHLVFEKNLLSLAELIDAIDSNFDGNERIKKMCENAPKFGNGIKEADDLRARITKEFYSELTSCPAEFNGTHWPGEVIFVYHMGCGEAVGALPDGRGAAQPLADSAGPSQGSDINGATRMLASCAALPHDESYYTSINVNIKFPM